MQATLDLPQIPRGTLLPEQERIERLERAFPVMLAATDGETDAVAIQATLAALLWEALPQASWCGFYRHTSPRMLTVGPYRGTRGCLRIPFERGVCGACARTGQTQLVEDVSKVADHIACDDASRSELVVPVFARGEVVAVLDLDSYDLAAFSSHEARMLEEFLPKAFATATF
jgi:GAF domain-containing protein